MPERCPICLHCFDNCACPKPYIIFPAHCERCGFPSIIPLSSCVFCKNRKLPFKRGVSAGVKFLHSRGLHIFKYEYSVLAIILSQRLSSRFTKGEEVVLIFYDSHGLSAFLKGLKNQGIIVSSVSKAKPLNLKSIRKSCKAIIYFPVLESLSVARKICVEAKRIAGFSDLTLAACLINGNAIYQW